jgi:hypothetical protein
MAKEFIAATKVSGVEIIPATAVACSQQSIQSYQCGKVQREPPMILGRVEPREFLPML